jgi:hypothetical protein
MSAAHPNAKHSDDEILAALARHGGDRKLAAAELGLHTKSHRFAALARDWCASEDEAGMSRVATLRWLRDEGVLLARVVRGPSRRLIGTGYQARGSIDLPGDVAHAVLKFRLAGVSLRSLT